MSQQPIDYKAVLVDLEAKLDKKRSAISTLQAQIVALEAAIDKLRVGLDLADSSPLLPMPLPSAPPPEATKPVSIGKALADAALTIGAVGLITGKPFRNQEMIKSILLYLQLIRSPQRTGEIVEGLRAGGYHFVAEKPSKSVSLTLVRLWKAGHVTRTVENVWGLSEWGEVKNPMPKPGGNVVAA
jgi:hypothetical protein